MRRMGQILFSSCPIIHDGMGLLFFSEKTTPDFPKSSGRSEKRGMELDRPLVLKIFPTGSGMKPGIPFRTTRSVYLDSATIIIVLTSVWYSLSSMDMI